MTISSTPSVWAGRVGRYLRFATARSAALRAEPSAKSQAKPAAAIAIDAGVLRTATSPTGGAGASNASTFRSAGVPTDLAMVATRTNDSAGRPEARKSAPFSTWLWLAAAILAPFAIHYISAAGQL
jgi:hypothetical protein